MDDSARPPLPWEEKAAIGALGLLALQEIQEGVRFCLREPALGFRQDHAAFPILLLLFAGVAIGLVQRSRLSWWLGVVLIGLLAVIYAAAAWTSVTQSLRFTSRMRSEVEYEWLSLAPYLDGFRMFWVIARSVLLLAVPALLLLGRLRKALREG